MSGIFPLLKLCEMTCALWVCVSVCRCYDSWLPSTAQSPVQSSLPGFRPTAAAGKRRPSACAAVCVCVATEPPPQLMQTRKQQARPARFGCCPLEIVSFLPGRDSATPGLSYHSAVEEESPPRGSLCNFPSCRGLVAEGS